MFARNIPAMKTMRLALLASSLLLAGCGLSQQEKLDLASVQNSGVNASTYDKMLHNDDLGVSDVCALERAGVNEGVILRYLRERGTVYVLSDHDIARLKSAGASESLIDYMNHTEVANAISYPTTTVYTYAPYGPIVYSQLSATSYGGTQYWGAYDPFYTPVY
jgi:hypothetical protein